MIRQLLTSGLFAALTVCAGSTSAQDSKTDPPPAPSDEDTVNPALDNCVTMPPTDMSVMSDQYVYIRSRGGNRYVMATAECKDLRRSYLRDEVQLVPYGPRVCQHDGSYLLYRTAGRHLTCAIATIHRVASRAEARSLVDKNQALIQVEKADPPE